MLYLSVSSFGGPYKGCISCPFVLDINAYYDITASQQKCLYSLIISIL